MEDRKIKKLLSLVLALSMIFVFAVNVCAARMYSEYITLEPVNTSIPESSWSQFWVYSPPNVREISSGNYAVASITSRAAVQYNGYVPMHSTGVGMVVKGYIQYQMSNSAFPTTSYIGSQYELIGNITGGQRTYTTKSYTASVSLTSGATLQKVGSWADYYYDCTSSNYPSTKMWYSNWVTNDVSDVIEDNT